MIDSSKRTRCFKQALFGTQRPCGPLNHGTNQRNAQRSSKNIQMDIAASIRVVSSMSGSFDTQVLHRSRYQRTSHPEGYQKRCWQKSMQIWVFDPKLIKLADEICSVSLTAGKHPPLHFKYWCGQNCTHDFVVVCWLVLYGWDEPTTTESWIQFCPHLCFTSHTVKPGYGEVLQYNMLCVGKWAGEQEQDEKVIMRRCLVSRCDKALQ